MLLGLSAVNVIAALAYLGFALAGPAGRRNLAVIETIISFGFAVGNAAIGFALLVASRKRLG
ncbi:MAG TPA: hypothetical protein VLU92_05515 [Candidatus Dormibacteraeota bacterium]|nr:hypothetical protein [Candidatus Dormibacteraeota bacterium]